LDFVGTIWIDCGHGVSEIKSIGHPSDGIPKKGDAKVATVAGEYFIICRGLEKGVYVFKLKPIRKIARGIGGGHVIPIKVVVSVAESVYIPVGIGANIVTNQGDILAVSSPAFLRAESKQVSGVGLAVR
jgi:hypothetical protein